MLQAHLLSDLYWFTCVIEAGSFSAAAQRTGSAKSSLSRRLAQLEQQLGVQLVNRSSRAFSLTSVGEEVYRHALDMLAAADAAAHSAQKTLAGPSGLLRLAAPGILSAWLFDGLADFRARHPQVSYALTQADGQLELRAQRLDLSLSLGSVPQDSSDVVARPMAQLRNLIVGSPALVERLGHPSRCAALDDEALLTLGSLAAPLAWPLEHGPRTIANPAFCADHLGAVRDAARAGLGLACLPAFACRDDLAAGTLALACPEDRPAPTTLYALTPSHRSITQTTRYFLEHLRLRLSNSEQDDMQPAGASAARP
ncbi:LysR substrate-binding domain-containing protein [Pseudomonas subflava]|uniref:LysR substrate-binding domain-containing protein n=1 Tax=Pseudomonas subflava TaxID=2952933 RepID=UPI00207A1B50|nr:LysR substrate-binding domain-containing protein [Pseudomonas subflava]